MSEEQRNEFNVVQFFKNDTYEYIKRNTDVRTAIEVAARCTRSVGAQLGIVVKVIVTDGDDFTNFMWEHGRGIVYPPEAVGRV